MSESAAPVVPALSSATSNPKTSYTGSCHCGTIKYILFITSKPCLDPLATPLDADGTRIEKCNCTTCHKMALFHVKPVSPADDFVLLSPLAAASSSDAGGLGGPFGNGLGEGISNYTCFAGEVNWWFCNKCGVRCFGSVGEAEIGYIDLEKWRIEGGQPANEPRGTPGSTRVWRLKKLEGDPKEREKIYLTVNAQTLDHDQEGLDLREWFEKKWIRYIDFKDPEESDELRYDGPFEGGTY
jgi:hypothetical protein